MWKVICFCLLLITAADAVVQSGKAYCFKSGNLYRMTFVLLKNDDIVAAVYGLEVGNESNELVQGCSTSTSTGHSPAEITGDGTAATPFTVTVMVNNGAANINCGHQATGQSYQWLFRTGSVILLQKPSDKIFSITCNFDAISDNLAATADVTVTGDQIHSVITPLGESISISLVSASNAAISNVALGAAAKIQVTLVQQTNGAKGVYTHDCWAGDTADFSGVNYQLTDQYGCTVTTLLADGFMGVTAPYQVTRSGLFNVFRFKKSSLIFFRCKIDYCYGTNDDACRDFCAHSGEVDGVVRRRRRSVDDGKRENVILTSYVIANIHEHVLANPGEKTQPGSCFTKATLVAGFVILGAIVLLSLSVVFYMFYRQKLTNKIESTI